MYRGSAHRARDDIWWLQSHRKQLSRLGPIQGQGKKMWDFKGFNARVADTVLQHIR